MSTEAMIDLLKAAELDSTLAVCKVPADSFGGYSRGRVNLGHDFELSILGLETCLCKAGGRPVYVEQWGYDNVRHWSSPSEIEEEIERLRDLIAKSDGAIPSRDTAIPSRDTLAEYKAHRQRRKRQRAAARRAAAAAGWTPASAK